MKVAICSNRCDVKFGRRKAKRHCNTRGIVMIASRRSPPFRSRHGQRESACIIPCTIITPELPTLFNSFARFTIICDDRSYWFAIDFRRTAPPCAVCTTKERLGWPSNGCPRTRPISIPSKTYGTNRSTPTWPTWFLTTSTTCDSNCIMFWKRTDMNPTGFTRSSKLHDFQYKYFPLTK